LASRTRCTKAEKSGIGDRRAVGPENRAAGLGEALGEGPLGVVAGTVVGDQRIGLLDPALLEGPLAEGVVELRDGHRRAHDIGRLLGDDRGGGVHHHHQLLGLVGDRGGAERLGREREARQDIHVVAHHQFLGEALGHVGGRPAGILADELDLAARDLVAILLDVEVDAGLELVRGIGEGARIGQDDPDLQRLLRERGRRKAEPEAECGCGQQFFHRASSLAIR
jgi:hypothetical protein